MDPNAGVQHRAFGAASESAAVSGDKRRAVIRLKSLLPNK